ncbi:hypothetical protein PIB30_007485 [Stylosanthes scabra]|uniref:Uncharacterized protein n=1 Tax=Stylosanthes scabra TaxID=79078 RepID=A0ABU6S4H0_9FABA|nr:hypothetical protein [Stylosanthes scabra]
MMVDLFPSERDLRLQGGHQGKRKREEKQGKSVLPHGGRQCSGLFCPTVGANVLGWADSTSKRLTKLGTAREKCSAPRWAPMFWAVLPHGGRQCFGLGGLDFQEADQAWNGGGWTCKARCVLASKRADSTSKRLTKLGTAGGGPTRPLRRSSLEDGVTASAVVRRGNQIPILVGLRPFNC